MAGTFVSVLCCRSDRLVDALVSIAQTTDWADFLHQSAVLKIAMTNTTIYFSVREGELEGQEAEEKEKDEEDEEKRWRRKTRGREG